MTGLAQQAFSKLWSAQCFIKANLLPNGSSQKSIIKSFVNSS